MQIPADIHLVRERSYKRFLGIRTCVFALLECLVSGVRDEIVAI